jgi:glycosyltransferase involved in cell wall biosynthesis
MRICLVSAMFFSGRKIKVDFRPEVVLEAELRDRGHDVTTCTHWDPFHANDYDIIHVHHLGIGALRAMFTASRVPFVYTNHDLRAKYGLLSLPRRLAYRGVLSTIDAVVALSEVEACFLAEKYAVDPQRIRVISNGIDQRFFSYRRANACGRGVSFRFLYVGQLIPLKGLEVLFRALGTLKFDWMLNLVFHTSDIEPSLHQLATKLGISHRITFTGRLAGSELAEAYQSSDALVLPSFTEALPSVVSEAMLCGTPVVATDVGGVREQLGGFGVLVPARDQQALAAALTNISQRYDSFRAQGPAMSKHAERQSSISAMIGSHLELYSRLIAIGHTRRSPLSRWPVGSVGSRLVWLAASQRRRRCRA